MLIGMATATVPPAYLPAALLDVQAVGHCWTALHATSTVWPMVTRCRDPSDSALGPLASAGYRRLARNRVKPLRQPRGAWPCLQPYHTQADRPKGRG